MALWWTGAFLFFCAVAWRFFLRDYWFRPRVLAAAMRRQGIGGPPPSLMLGNLKEMFRMRLEAEARGMEGISHDIVKHVQPYFAHYSKIYGIPFMIWWSYEPRVVVTDLDMIKEVLYNKAGHFGRSALQQKFLIDILGRGLVVVNGEEWALSRRIVSPAFHLEKIRGMVGTMAICVVDMLKKWDISMESRDDSVEVEVVEQFAMLAADVISRTAFGSNFETGHRVFQLLQVLGPLVMKANTGAWIPGSRVVPTRLNRQIKKIQRELEVTLEGIIQARRESKKLGKVLHYGSDLLGIMLEEADASCQNGEKNLVFTSKDLIEECKTFYLAGHETTASLLTWTMMLLATNPSWQERARAEVLEICNSDVPDADDASKLKVVGMILNEALRLYPPAVFLVRNAFKDTKVGNLMIPSGMGILVPIVAILHDPELWGADVHEFNPERFADGVANASKHPFAFMPFSHGPRVCVGQTFALMEAKVALAMILQRFSFELSPRYRHNPVLRLGLKPKDGLPLLIRRL